MEESAEEEEMSVDAFRSRGRAGSIVDPFSGDADERAEESSRRRRGRWLMDLGELDVLLLFDDDDGEELCTDGELRSWMSLIDVFPFDRVARLLDDGNQSDPLSEDGRVSSFSSSKSVEGCSSSSSSSSCCWTGTRGTTSRMMGRGGRSASVVGEDEEGGDGGELRSWSSSSSSNFLFPSSSPNASPSPPPPSPSSSASLSSHFSLHSNSNPLTIPLLLFKTSNPPRSAVLLFICNPSMSPGDPSLSTPPWAKDVCLD